MSDSIPAKRPLLRGYFHQEAFFVAIGACALLIARSSSDITLMSSLIYTFGLLASLGISALYHRPNWQPSTLKRMKRLDHSAIFLLIAGTFTPICLLALPPTDGRQLLITVWGFASLGILQAMAWSSAPKWFRVLFYVVVGWLALPYLNQLEQSLGSLSVGFLAAGGVAYTVGAVIYFLKIPKSAAIFGYHEAFHVMTIIGAVLHFLVVYRLIV
jgi:hemolysin III